MNSNKTKSHIHLKLLILIIFLLAIIALESLPIYITYQNPQPSTLTVVNEPTLASTEKAVDIEYNAISQVAKQPKSVNSLTIEGWIADWDLNGGLNAMKNNSDLNEISPFWLMPNDDGSLKEVNKNVNAEILNYAKAHNISIIPTIPLTIAGTLSKILNDPNNTERHINSILNEVDQHNYDGIDLDYESMYLFDKKYLFNFLTELSTKLHQRGKKLIFSAIPKWGDFVKYPTFQQTRRVEDYARIGALVDEFRIMAYNTITGRDSPRIGPIAPLKWLEQVLKYAIYEGVPRDKIVLGIHDFIYDWSSRTTKPDDIDLFNWYEKPNPNLPRASAYYEQDLQKLKQNYNYTEYFNNAWGEMVLKYNYKGQDRVAVYLNQKSIDLRKQLAADYGIKGIVYWRLGGEGELKL